MSATLPSDQRRARRSRSPSDAPTLPAILEFQWPSTAIVNAPIPRSAHGVIWVVSSMVFALIGVMALIPIDQVVTARGIVVSQARNIRVQPLETAIVRSIDVREGEEVRQGQLLARLDPTFANADLTAISMQVASLKAEVARLRAEADGTPFAFQGSDPNWTLQATIFDHRRAEFEAKVENYKDRIDELSSIISRTQSDAAAYRERLGFAQDVETMRKTLESHANGSRLNTLLAGDTRAEMARALANAVDTEQGAKLNQAALAAERDAYSRGWRADVAQQLSEASKKLNDAQEQLDKAKLRRQLVELRSGTDAIVQSVAKVSVGSVLQSGDQFIVLVPSDAKLEVEANISGQESGYVHLADSVAIKFDTFPYSQYGMAVGTVRIVSPSSFTAQEEQRNPTSAMPTTPNASEPFYRARIAIDKVALRGVPSGFRVIPGMPVTADIKVGKRTVLQYLFGLMLPVAQEAMREP
ncbi:MAG TPA: HlyD family type I secretion periplasmic adaptor subunit [Roseiarcus sp.]